MAISPPSLERRDLEQLELSYQVGGTGPPLVLVHGLGGAAENWVDLAPRLLERYRVLVPDLPGHGESGPGRWEPTLAGFAAAVQACAHAELSEPAVVVGHSLGGQIALELALMEPPWPRAIVLAAVSGISSQRPGRRGALNVSTIIRPARRADPLRPWILRHRLTRRLAFWGMVSDVDSLSDESAEAFFAGAARATTTRPGFRALMQCDPRPSLADVDVPALVMWGARDAALPVSDAFDYTRRLRAPLRVLPDTGHLLIGERPELCARLIDEFASEL